MYFIVLVPQNVVPHYSSTSIVRQNLIVSETFKLQKFLSFEDKHTSLELNKGNEKYHLPLKNIHIYSLRFAL